MWEGVVVVRGGVRGGVGGREGRGRGNEKVRHTRVPCDVTATLRHAARGMG